MRTARAIAVVGASSLIGEAVIAELARAQVPVERTACARRRAQRRPARSRTRTGGETRSSRRSDVAAFDFSRVDLAFFCGRAALERALCRSGGRARLGDRRFAGVSCAGRRAAGRGRRECGRARGQGRARAHFIAGQRERGARHGARARCAALAGLERVEVATYQAVSGSGRAAMDELAGETVAMLSGKTARGRAFGRQIAFNVIPQVEACEADGTTREERRLWEETRRLLGSAVARGERDRGARAGVLRAQPGGPRRFRAPGRPPRRARCCSAAAGSR